jgi:branched-chain amino acid transport system permease protein
VSSRILTWLVVAAILLLLPLFVSPGTQHALVQAIIFALFAASFNLASGSGGMLSFGHSAFLAFGSFATLHVMRAVESGGLIFPTALLPIVGGVTGLMVGVVVGYFATLRSGVYFSMLTLAFAELFHQMAPNLTALFGGETGLSSIRTSSWGLSFANDLQVYYLVLAWGAVCLALLWLYMRTPFGRLTLAIRENEQRLRFLGFNIHVSKIVIFAVSCTIAGIAGGLLAVSNESANYELFSMTYSADVLLYTYIGGAGLFFGAPLGAAVLTLTGHAVTNQTHIWFLYQGLLFVLLMMYAPEGFGGILAKQIEMYREGRLANAAGPYLFAVIPGVCLLAAIIFLCEALSVVLSREYAARRLAIGGEFVPAQFLGTTWDPLSLWTWAIPIGLVLVCSLTLPTAIRKIRHVLKPS